MEREQFKNALAGLLRNVAADFPGIPVDTANTIARTVAPPESGNPYANAIRTAVGGGDIKTGSSDWFSERLGLPKGEGLAYEVARMLAPNPLELLSLVKGLGPVMREITTYHGTPHTFPPTEKNPLGEFDLSKVGSGEGVQAYGHGIYVAESPEVAKAYQGNLSYRDTVKDFLKHLPEDADFEETLDAAKYMRPEQRDFLHALAKDDWLGFDYPAQAITAALREIKSYDPSPELLSALDKIKGSLYTVDLPNEYLPNLMRWDKPLSEQPEMAQKALGLINPMPNLEEHLAGKTRSQLFDFADSVDSNNSFRDILHDEPNLTADELRDMLIEAYGDEDMSLYLKGALGPLSTGQSVYERLKLEKGSPAAASRALLDANIPGIRYLDEGSRRAGEGTSNFVVFDPSILNILRRE